MQFIKNIFLYSSLLLLLLLTACSSSTPKQEEVAEPVETAIAIPAQVRAPGVPAPLPVQYQTPIYSVDRGVVEELLSDEETSIKVGASIRSTRGPQPLWDILKKLAALKDMNVSWASDVDRDVLVDVDISANDDFYEAIDNMLRQVDYFHEMRNNTIVVKYKETRQFHIAMPFIKSTYKTSAGGNLLGDNDASSNLDGTVSLKAEDNSFDIWDSIQNNMDAIFEIWSTETIDSSTVVTGNDTPAGGDSTTDTETATATRRFAKGGNKYIIDKPIGLITVSAPRPLQDELDKYFTSLQRELYKQISIDAKIIEVELSSGSSIGIDWSGLLKGQSLNATATFGNSGQIWGDNDTWLPNGSKFLSSVTLGSLDFDLLFGALNEQGDAKVLSNPKISVMNGQPAMITVGKSITYISNFTDDQTTTDGVVEHSYSTETDSLLSGLGLGLTATILNDNQIIMNLVPITSQLDSEVADTVDTTTVDTITIGLPKIDVREMSTTVRIADGDTLIIGGLISESDNNTGTSVPILGDIPGLGYLFSYEEKTKVKKELVILIRPRII